MLVTAKILKRKDGSSVVVAVVIAMIIGQLLPAMTGSWANTLSGAEDGQTFTSAYPGANWQTHYLQPIVWAILQLLLLEVLVWFYGSMKDMMGKK